MITIGDLIIYQGEKGVVYHKNPDIMKTIDFHSYVPITKSFKVLEENYEDEKSVYIKPELVERITNYLQKKNLLSIPTGS